MRIDLPEVHFGSADDKPVDWRKATPDEAPDDVELEQTPQDVIDMLGFDPKDEGAIDCKGRAPEVQPDPRRHRRFAQDTAHWHKLARSIAMSDKQAQARLDEYTALKAKNAKKGTARRTG